MRNNRRLIALATLLFLGLTQARSHDALNAQEAQLPETTADVRCLVVGAIVIARDPTKQAAGMILAMYHIGRIEGRTPTADLEGLIVKQANAMTPADFASEAKRCGASLTAKGQELTQIGKRISERAKTQSDQSNPPAN